MNVIECRLWISVQICSNLIGWRQSLWLESMTHCESTDDVMTGMDSMNCGEYALLISLLNSLLLLGTDGSELERNLQKMSECLSDQKEMIISRNESVHNGEELQLLKSRYYLRLSQLNEPKAASTDDEVQRKKWTQHQPTNVRSAKGSLYLFSSTCIP